MKISGEVTHIFFETHRHIEHILFKYVYNKFPIHYGLFFATLKMRPLKGLFRTEVVFEDKNFQFLSSKQLRSDRLSLSTSFFS